MEHATHPGGMYFDRSIGLTYSFSKLTNKTSSLGLGINFSINDYIMPSVSYAIDLYSQPAHMLDAKYGIIFQSPSHCWQFEGFVDKSIDKDLSTGLTFTLNLTGGTLAGNSPVGSTPATTADSPLDDQLRKQ